MVQLSTLAALATAIVGVHSYGAPCPDDKCAKSATPYCSSYLGVPKKTVTSTYTSTAVITKYTSTKNVYGEPTTITTTLTVPKTEKTTTTLTSSTTTQSTVTITPTCKAPAGPVGVNLGDRRKRDNYGYGQQYGQPYGPPAKPTKPACLSSYKEHADVTKACQCLSIKPSTTTVKTTITQTSTVKKCKYITKAATITSTTTIEKGKTTKTETTTVTSTSTLDPATVSAPVATPTNFNIIYSDSTDTVEGNYYANVDITPVQKRVISLDQSQPIVFELPSSGTTATVFSLDDNNSLTIPASVGAINTIAQLPGGTADPQKLTYGSDGTVAVTCTITANADSTCGLQCTGENLYDVEYSCGHTGLFELGSGSSTTEPDSPSETCTAITPFVVDVGDPLITVPGTGSDPTGGLISKKIVQ